jgi:peptide/nickel transport system substrate-binding protein
MTNRIKGILLFISLLTVFSMLVVACAPAATQAPEVEEPEAPEVEEPEVEEPEDEEPMDEEPAEREIVGSYAQSEDFLTLDPSVGMAMEMVLFVNLYEGLTYTPEYDTQLALPLLATDWEANEDGTEWTFNLREGVKFHDGTDFTAEAVKYSYERTLRMAMGGSYILDPIAQEGAIEVVDDYTIRFHLAYPAPMDIIAASAYAAWIMSPSTTQEMAGDTEDWFNQGNDAGTGPYMIESYERGRRVVFQKFEDYWGGWEPRSFDRVFMDVVEDPIVLQQMIESGEADITFGIPPENRPVLEARDDVTRVEEETFIVWYVPINTQHPPLDNKLVRQALAYTFPYQDVIGVILDGFGEQAVTTVPRGAWGYCDTCMQYSHDLEKAADLLTEAGYPDGGFELEIVVFAGTATSEQYAELWKAELAELGIDLTITPATTEAAYSRARSSPEEATDLIAFSWWQDIVHPLAFLQLPFQCEEDIFFNFSYWCNEEFDAMLWEGFEVSASDREDAIRIYEDAQKILIEEVPAIFQWQEIKNWYVRSDVEGFVPNPAYTQAVFWKFLTRAE